MVKEGQSTNKEGTVNQISCSCSRRKMLSMLGVGSFGLFSSQSTVSAQQSHSQQDSPRGGWQNWTTDINANGHSLSNLDALTMVDNSTTIRDFEGDNLLVDESGTLNASPGEGWGASGELVPLFSQRPEDGHSFRDPDFFTARFNALIPFESIDLTNIEQTYVSATGIITKDVPLLGLASGDIDWRAGQTDEGLLIPNSEMQTPNEGPFHSPKAPYSASELTPISFVSKGVDAYGFKDITVHVWGEIK